MATPRPARGRAPRDQPLARQGQDNDGAAAKPQQLQHSVLEREPVLLILDSSLQAVPWESVPGMRRQR